MTVNVEPFSDLSNIEPRKWSGDARESGALPRGGPPGAGPRSAGARAPRTDPTGRALPGSVPGEGGAADSAAENTVVDIDAGGAPDLTPRSFSRDERTTEEASHKSGQVRVHITVEDVARAEMDRREIEALQRRVEEAERRNRAERMTVRKVMIAVSLLMMAFALTAISRVY